MSDPEATIPPQFRENAERLPAPLRAVLDAEMAAGNQIIGDGPHDPARPAELYFKLARPITTGDRISGGGLKFYDYNSHQYAGLVTDDTGNFYLVESALPPEPPTGGYEVPVRHPPSPRWLRVGADPTTAAGRFERSFDIDREKWREGIGYDIEALKAATLADRRLIEMMLGTVEDWRDVEALAALGTPRANERLLKAVDHRDAKISMAVLRYAPELLPEAKRVSSLVSALNTARLDTGLSEALDEAAEFHPKEVVDTLFHCLLTRDGESKVHFAALLMYVHGKAAAPFDWEQRPFFLRFNTRNGQALKTVFLELCDKIGADASPYLGHF